MIDYSAVRNGDEWDIRVDGKAQKVQVIERQTGAVKLRDHMGIVAWRTSITITWLKLHKRITQ